MLIKRQFESDFKQNLALGQLDCMSLVLIGGNYLITAAIDIALLFCQVTGAHRNFAVVRKRVDRRIQSLRCRNAVGCRC